MRTALLVDRHPLWLGAVERLLQGNGFVVGAKLDSAREAVEAVRTMPLDLVVTDVGTADGPLGGLDVLAAARERGVSAIVLAERNDAEAIKAAFAAGAAAYVLKSAEPGELTVAARQPFSRSIYTRVPTPAPAAVEPQEDNPLTPREREVIALAAQGRSNAEISTALRITEQTVKLHLANTYRKLGVANRTQAGRRATELGLLERSPPEQVELHLLASTTPEVEDVAPENPGLA